MISRYENNKIKIGRNGRRAFRPKIYPNIPLRDDDRYVITETGDRLDHLAYKYYRDASMWWIIASANNIHNAPLGIADGTVLRIPQNYIEICNNFRN